MDARSTTGAEGQVNIRDFRLATAEIVGEDSATATIKFRYSLRAGVDLTAASTKSNPWMYAALRETADQTEVTEVSVSDGVQAVAINIDLAYDIAPEVTAISGGNVSVTIFGTNNS